MNHYFIRLGSQAEIHIASALAPYSRATAVAVRSPRGLEIAEVVAPVREDVQQTVHHRISRPLSEADRFLLDRLQGLKREAIESCRLTLEANGCDAVLLDIDFLLDGGTLVMQFLGEVGGEAQRISDEVAAHYEAMIERDALTLATDDHCGTGCGSCSNQCSSCSHSPEDSLQK